MSSSTKAAQIDITKSLWCSRPLSKDLPEIDQITFKDFSHKFTQIYLEKIDQIDQITCYDISDMSLLSSLSTSSSSSSCPSPSTLRCLKYGSCHLCRTVNMFSKSDAIRNQRDVKLNFIFSSMCPLCSTWQRRENFYMLYEHIRLFYIKVC